MFASNIWIYFKKMPQTFAKYLPNIHSIQAGTGVKAVYLARMGMFNGLLLMVTCASTKDTQS